MVDTDRFEAMVEFDYIAQEPDELTIRKGDIIKDIKTQPGGWWEGTLGDKRGMFPDNFVRILADAPKQKESPVVSLRTKVGGRRCRVLFSYQPVNDDELQLEVNDIIEVLAEVEEGWWKGKLRDMVGVFPSNFVSEIKDPLDESSGMQASPDSKSRNSIVSNESSDGALQSSPDSSHEPGKEDSDAPLLPPKPVKELCRVMFPYEAANDDELTLKEGDVILLVSKEVADKGWWRGELRGRVGVFPDNFVEVIQQEEASKKPERPPSKSLLSTTNRIRDTITKPTTNASRNDHVDVAPNKKSQDEKPVFPPVPGKKPHLPPPMKKPPQRIVSSTTSRSQDPAERPFSDSVDGIGSSRMSQNSYGVPKNSSRDEVPEFDSVERSEMLNHPTAGRVKAPRRRPPKNMHSRENDTPHGLVNGNQEEVEPMKPNGPHVSPQVSPQAPSQGIPQAARQWENKSKAPWMEELKLNQARKQPPGAPGAPGAVVASSTPSVLSASGAPGPLKSPPTANSVSEHSTSVRDSPHHAVGRHSLGAETNIPATADFPSKPSFVSGNSKQTSDRPLSKDLSTGLPHKPHSLSTPSLHAVDESHASDINQNLKSSLKQSPSAASDIPIKAEGSSMSASHYGSHGPGHTGTSMPSVQYLELMEKIVKLEKSVEQQRATFTQAIKEITDKLNEERNRRTHLEQELDKLTNLVTQV